MPSKTKTRIAAIAAKTAALPKPSKELLDQITADTWRGQARRRGGNTTHEECRSGPRTNSRRPGLSAPIQI